MPVNNEKLFRLTYDMRNNLNSLHGLIDKMDKFSTEKEEKKQCIEMMRDFVNKLLTKTDSITLFYGNEENTIDDYSRIGLQTNFTMVNTKALIVDDNEVNNYAVSQMLKNYDIEVDIALSGEKAIELYKKNEYSFILMDYLMPPGMNGIETVAKIREIGERGKNQLIIGLTVHTLNEFKEGLNSYGVELIILKPVKNKQIEVILQNEFKDRIYKKNCLDHYKLVKRASQ